MKGHIITLTLSALMLIAALGFAIVDIVALDKQRHAVMSCYQQFDKWWAELHQGRSVQNKPVH